MYTYLFVFFAQLIYVALKSAQQLNVVHNNYKAIVPISIVMAACEVGVVGAIAVKQDWSLVVPMGIGAALGCMLGMYLHRKFRNGQASSWWATLLNNANTAP